MEALIKIKTDKNLNRFVSGAPMETRTTLVTGKGQVYFVNKLLAEKAGYVTYL